MKVSFFFRGCSCCFLFVVLSPYHSVFSVSASCSFLLSQLCFSCCHSVPPLSGLATLSHGFGLGWASCCSLQAEGRQRTDGGWSGPDTRPSHPKCGGGEDRKEELLAVPTPLTMSPPAAGLHQMLGTLAAGTVESGAFGPSL